MYARLLFTQLKPLHPVVVHDDDVDLDHLPTLVRVDDWPFGVGGAVGVFFHRVALPDQTEKTDSRRRTRTTLHGQTFTFASVVGYVDSVLNYVRTA